MPPVAQLQGLGGSEALDRRRRRRRTEHRDRIPISDHLFRMMMLVQADVTEKQLQKMSLYMAIFGKDSAIIHIGIHQHCIIGNLLWPKVAPREPTV